MVPNDFSDRTIKIYYLSAYSGSRSSECHVNFEWIPQFYVKAEEYWMCVNYRYTDEYRRIFYVDVFVEWLEKRISSFRNSMHMLEWTTLVYVKKKNVAESCINFMSYMHAQSALLIHVSRSKTSIKCITLQSQCLNFPEATI